MEEITLEAIRDVLAGHSLDGTTLEALAGSLDRVFAARPSVLEALEWEDVYLRKTILEVTFWGKAFPFEPELPRPGWRQVYSDGVMRAQAIGLLSEWIRMVRLSGSGTFVERRRRLAEAAAFGASFDNPVAKSWYSPIAKSATRADRTLLGYRLFRLSVALAWFQAEKGREAASLEELVPRYVQALPECPLSGTAFRYVPGKVWSVGKDGRDDGGLIDEAEGYNPDREGTDAVWFVRRK